MSSSSDDFDENAVPSDERRPAPVQPPQQPRVVTRSSRSNDTSGISNFSAPRNAADFSDNSTPILATPMPMEPRDLPPTLQLGSQERSPRIYPDSSSIEYSSSLPPHIPSILEEPHHGELYTHAQVQQILLNHGIRTSQSPTFQIPHRTGPFSSPSSDSSSSASSTSFVEPISTRSPLLLRIPEAEFPKTTTAQSKQLEEIIFSNNSSHNKKNLKTFVRTVTILP
jgi:hypothetical protein